ncbi:SAF domain-containing protein [Actinomadura soli]|nr:SAF domain-containing protein [Actinomadura soli]
MKTSSRTLPKPIAPKGSSGPDPRVSKRLARQRRPSWIAAGVMLLMFAVLANVYLFRASDERVPVLRLTRDVPVGQQITRADLDVARVTTDPAVSTIPERQLREVVGRRAAVGLRKGTLLAASQLAAGPSPQRGQALVTAPVKASALPPGLAPGWRVRVVFRQPSQDQHPMGGDAQGRADGGQGTLLRDVVAVVDQVQGPDAEGAMTVSLLMAEADSSLVARQAAAGQVVLVVTERRG